MKAEVKTPEDLVILIKNPLQNKMRANKIIPSLMENGQAFENWIQVTLADILMSHGFDSIKLEASTGIDIIANELSIEIKIIKSGWSNLTQKGNELPGDFKKLNERDNTYGYFLFLHYPLRELDKFKDKDHYLSVHFKSIMDSVTAIDGRSFYIDKIKVGNVTSAIGAIAVNRSKIS